MKADEHPLSQNPLIERITPGPWHLSPLLEPVEGNAYWVYSENQVCIAEVQEFTLTYEKGLGLDTPEKVTRMFEANAEAISRVPELLKAEQELSDARLSVISADVAIEFITKEREKERELWKIKIQELEETLSRLQTGWIDVFAKQPPEHDDVLLLVSRADTIPSGVIVGHRANGTYYDQDGSALGNATHWMDLPKKQ